MTCDFKPSITQSLTKKLKTHLAVNVALETTGLGLIPILKGCTLMVPREYRPGVGWTLMWSPCNIPIKWGHIDLVEKILKLAWLYSSIPHDEFVRSSVARELTMFEAGAKLESYNLQRRRAAKAPRTWTALRAWIWQELEDNPDLGSKELWGSLPISSDGQEIYHDGDQVFCAKGSRKPIKLRTFENHVREVRKKVTG